MTFRARKDQLLKSTSFKDEETRGLMEQVASIRPLTKADGSPARKCIDKE